MAKRSENRDKAYEIWLNRKGEISLKDIASQIGVSDTLVRKWKSQDKWALSDGNIGNGWHGNVTVKNGNVTKKTGAPYGNKNAVGHGAPKGNKNAARPHRPDGYRRNTNGVKTGEYQTIWLDTMDEDERALFEAIDTSPMAQLDEDIRLLTYRERRMLTYLNELKRQKDLAEKEDAYMVKDVPTIVEVYDEATGETRQQKITEEKKVLVGQTVRTKLLLDKILHIEEALTRVQEKKIRAIEAKHRIMKEPYDTAGSAEAAVHIINNIPKPEGGDHS